LSLIALTIVIHALCVAFMALVLLSIEARLESRSLGIWHAFAIVIGTIGAVGLLLAVVHGIEAAFWAAAYLWLGALDSPEDAIFYSFDSMTTRGASGLTLQPHWRMMGALEAADGMLLFGISTAFIFAVIAVWTDEIVCQRQSAAGRSRRRIPSALKTEGWLAQGPIG
jgi:hypothetical protein